MEDLEQRIQQIEDRNRKVEKDKAWEISITRRIILAITSYVIVAIFFIVIKLPNPWVNALVPALAFIIQQLSMPFLKKIWLKFRR